MISKRIMINVMVVCIVAMLAEQTEGFLTFLSPRDYQKKIENYKSRMNLQKRSEENNLPEVSSMEEMKVIKLCVPFEIGIKLSSKQFQKYGEHLGELLQNILSENKNGQ
ncbi:promotilin-like [Hemiscyllium ocellatum]|uniref:promotilin-like n=1 Tax=Hemiscyllium ocellatum TaxID=170820 RepID=UPI0029674CAE|nr:promotilin-like [Hemiscyllium ocellatum]